jgi:hypothetical protein
MSIVLGIHLKINKDHNLIRVGLFSFKIYFCGRLRYNTLYLYGK